MEWLICRDQQGAGKVDTIRFWCPIFPIILLTFHIPRLKSLLLVFEWWHHYGGICNFLSIWLKTQNIDIFPCKPLFVWKCTTCSGAGPRGRVIKIEVCAQTDYAYGMCRQRHVCMGGGVSKICIFETGQPGRGRSFLLLIMCKIKFRSLLQSQSLENNSHLHSSLYSNIAWPLLPSIVIKMALLIN